MVVSPILVQPMKVLGMPSNFVLTSEPSTHLLHIVFVVGVVMSLLDKVTVVALCYLIVIIISRTKPPDIFRIMVVSVG